MRRIVAVLLIMGLSACAAQPSPSAAPLNVVSTVAPVASLIGGSTLPAQSTTIPAAIPSTPSTAQKLVAYYTSWSIYGPQYYVTDIPAELITHLNYAFMNISDQGECILGDPLADTQFQYEGDQQGEPLLGNFKQLKLLK